MKIAINICFGGFSLSPDGVKRYAELKGWKCYFFSSDLKTDIYTEITIDEARSKGLFWSAFKVKNPNEYLRNKKKWDEMTMKEKQASNKKHDKVSITSGRDIPRDDPTLIQVIEELGEKADGRCAKLKLVEIPDGVEWEIDEYDGLETIDEKHRSWS